MSASITGEGRNVSPGWDDIFGRGAEHDLAMTCEDACCHHPRDRPVVSELAVALTPEMACPLAWAFRVEYHCHRVWAV